MQKLTYDKNGFYIDQKPLHIISGTIHYFRVHKDAYRDRLTKLKQCGFNTVETYVAWNIIERREGVFDYDGIFDLALFLDTAKELGLYAIVRPGPYICAEWDLGGLPAWLLTKELVLRHYDEQYLYYVRRYFTSLFEILRPRLLENGGNIIMMQVENEYGSYSDDKPYLCALRDMYKELNMPVTLFTSDGPSEEYLSRGMIDGVLATVNFGSRPKESFEMFRRLRPDDPLMCTEFWCGWFDHWGEHHHTRPADDAAKCFDEMLSMGAAVNFYVFCGGTNFAFMNGANFDGNIQPTVTSYDYDALLDESGRRTAKYYAVRDVIKKHFGVPDGKDLPEMPAKAYGEVELTRSCDAFDMLGSAYVSADIPTAEAAECDYGYMLYSCEAEKGTLTVGGVRDIAYVYANERFLGKVIRSETKDFKLSEFAVIDIFVDNTGRVNYGSELPDRKGIIEPIKSNGKAIKNYSVFRFGDDMIQNADYEDGVLEACPVMLWGEFSVARPADTYLYLPSFTRGAAFINGFCIGRYDKAGPQRSLFVPRQLLAEGENTIEIFELEDYSEPVAVFDDKPELG